MYRIFLEVCTGMTVIFSFFPWILVLQSVINFYAAYGLIQTFSPVNGFCWLASYFCIVFNFLFIYIGVGLHCDEFQFSFFVYKTVYKVEQFASQHGFSQLC